MDDLGKPTILGNTQIPSDWNQQQVKAAENSRVPTAFRTFGGQTILAYFQRLNSLLVNREG